MLYRVGDADQVTTAASRRHARGYLRTILDRLAHDSDCIQLPRKIIRRTLAEAYAWVAEEELIAGNGLSAARCYSKSLSLNFFQKRAMLMLPFCLLPDSLRQLARSVKQRLAGPRHQAK
jgi:hypothetical protein